MRGQFSKYKPPGDLYLEGRFNGGFFCVTGLGGLCLEGLIHGRAYFRNFAVFRSIYNLIIFNLLRSIVKRSKELSKLQCLWDFYILFDKFKEKTIFFSRTPPISLSLLRTLNLPPGGVRNNGGKHRQDIRDSLSLTCIKLCGHCRKTSLLSV